MQRAAVRPRSGSSTRSRCPRRPCCTRAAVGHVHEGADDPVRAPVWQLPRSLGPAGLITLDRGRRPRLRAAAPDRRPRRRRHPAAQSRSRAAAMADQQADLPDKYSLGDSWGLGWIRFGWDGHRLVGHDGNTIGQAAFLRVLPEQGLAVTLLTNGGNTRDLYEELYREIFAELAGVAMPRPLTPPAEPVHGRRHAVRSAATSASSVRMEVLRAATAPRLRTTVTGPLAELMPDPVDEYPLVPVGDRPVRGAAARGRDLGAGDVLRAAHRRAVPALRRAGHSEGGWTSVARRPAADLPQLIADIEELVELRVAVDRSRRGRGQRRRRRPGRHAPGSASARSGSCSTGRPICGWRLGAGPRRVLLLGHHDTVWPLGSLADPSVSRSTDGVLRGPGLLRHEGRAGRWPSTPSPRWPTATVSPCWSPATRRSARPSSRALIEEEARAAAAALVLEASADGGALKTERKGVSLYEVADRGRAAHAGSSPRRGVNATVELAHQVLAVGRARRPGARHDGDADVLVGRHHDQYRPGRRVVRGRRAGPHSGTSSSGWTRRCGRCAPSLDGAALRCTGGPNRPPLDAAASAAAVRTGRPTRRASSGCRAVTGAAVGGASDGNFTAGVGTPPSTGSAPSAAARTPTTSTSWSTSCPARIALLTALLADVLATDDRTHARAGSTMTHPGDAQRGRRATDVPAPTRRCCRRRRRRARRRCAGRG